MEPFQFHVFVRPISVPPKVQSPVVDTDASLGSIPSSRTIPNKAK